MIYGGSNLSNIDLTEIENAPNGSSDLGFRASNGLVGWTVSGGGDINGDGFDDLYFGTVLNNSDSYVLYGGNNLSNIDASDIEDGTADGIVIHGTDERTRSGNIIGDVNGDGLDDMLFSEPSADQSNTPNASVGYVVFGGNNLPDIEFSDIAAGNGGFVINGVGDFKSFESNSAGDVNGDGFDDLIFSHRFDRNPRGDGFQSTVSYVVFGGSHSSHIELADIDQGIGGFAINGPNLPNRTGYRVRSGR